MDGNLEMNSQDEPFSTNHTHMDVGLASDRASRCVMCRRTFSPDNDSFEPINVCGDCKFLLLEDLGVTEHNSLRRRRRRRRRIRYSSSESIENIFSQQISHLFNLVRHNHSAVSNHENQSINGDHSPIGSSTHTTSIGYSRRRRVFYDSESEGFSNLESDAISFSTYGGDSDVSVDGNSVLDMEILNQQDDGSNLDSDSDTDIDPMNAALDRWNSDDDEEEDDDGEWEEYTGESADSRPPQRNEFISQHRLFDSPESEALIHWRIRNSRSEFTQSLRNPGDYLDARGFEELLEHLADGDSSRRGAPPTSVSFVKSLPRFVIDSQIEKLDDLACAICKDVLSVGTEVNKLPCLHLYHPACILPWLRTRNSCPLCRFELPTDDMDYEEGKRSRGMRLRIREIEQQDRTEDGLSDGLDGDEGTEIVRSVDVSDNEREGRRRGWFLIVAAPVVSIVGIVIVLWLGNSRGNNGRGLSRLNALVPERNQRAHRSRRWWSFF